MNRFTLGSITFDERRQAARFLRGAGIEIGGSHLPIDIDRRCCSVQYVDKLTASEIRSLFPELDDYSIIPTDIICDVVKKRLSPFGDETQDFVIASHLVEHLPNPLGFIKECYRALRQNGVFYLVVPDKNFTFDRDRDVTPLAHIVQDMKNDMHEVDESHLSDWLLQIRKRAVPEDLAEKQRLFQWELERSIHVHVWTWEGVVEFLRYLIIEEGVSWELCEFYLPKEGQDEVICVLRKTPWSPQEAIARFDVSVETLLARENAMKAVIRSFQKHEQASPTPSNGQKSTEGGSSNANQARCFQWLSSLGLRRAWSRARWPRGRGRE